MEGYVIDKLLSYYNYSNNMMSFPMRKIFFKKSSVLIAESTDNRGVSKLKNENAIIYALNGDRRNLTCIYSVPIDGEIIPQWRKINNYNDTHTKSEFIRSLPDTIEHKPQK